MTMYQLARARRQAEIRALRRDLARPYTGQGGVELPHRRGCVHTRRATTAALAAA